MDAVINRLSQIEKAAGAILDDGNARKKEFAREMEEKTAAFDAALEKETADRIARIQARMEEHMKEMLDKQTSDSIAFLKELEENYEKSHETYAEVLFQRMIKE